MAIKVHELAKEMGIPSKELIEKLAGQGIAVKSHMSALTDEDIKKIKGGSQAGTAPAKAKSTKAEAAEPVKAAGPSGAGMPGRPPMGSPAGGTTRRPPIGRPVVDKAYLESKGKEKTDEEPAVQAAPAAKSAGAEAKPAAPAAEKPAAAEAKPATPAAKPAAAEPKPAAPATAKPAAPAAAKPATPAADKPLEAPARRPLGPKIIERASDRPAEAPARRPLGPKIIERASDRPAAKTGDRPARTGDRPARSGDRPVRTGDRPARTGDRPARTGDRPARTGDRPARTGDRPARTGDRPVRSGDRPVRSGDRPAAASAGKKNTHDNRNKDRDKFDKFDRKSLEKQTRKKHVKNKPAPEPEVVAEPLPEGTIVVNVPITVAGFCEQAEVSTSMVIMTLMKLGIMANINQTIDEDTLMVLAEELKIQVAIGNVEKEEVEEGLETFEDQEDDLQPRPPIITVMGHVDHGKTSLLDAIRKTNVTAQESGGITQHIGASEVSINGQKIVFLDTPGHEAFTAMRARGAHITDIAVLVVAADDGVKPQTIESISHAKAAGVPVIVAINKMDKAGANPDRVKQELSEQGILVEDWGGDVISVPVSAKSGDGIVNLLEMILLQAEVLELKANPNRLAMGSVIEARLDKAKGPVATLLVTNGTLQAGQSVVAGTCSGRIRLMTDFMGKKIKKAGPATAVEILGLTEVPQAGDEFNAVKDDRVAREIADKRKEKIREEVFAKNASMTLDKLFSQMQEGEVKELNLIIKADVQGSVGAMVSSLEKLNNENVRVNVIHTGVGTVTESDIMLAGTSGAVIVGFNVRPTTAVQTMADREGVEIRTYRVIYDLIDDVENAMKGMLDPEFKEEILGKVEVRTTFKVSGVGVIAGAYVTEGKVLRNAEVRLVRDGIVIHEGKISSLKRFKDDAKEVAQGYECGIGLEDYNDIKESDVIECFHMVEIKQ